MPIPRAPGSPSAGRSAVVTRRDPMSPWDGGVEGWPIASGEQVVWRARGPVTQGTTEVGASELITAESALRVAEAFAVFQEME